MYLSSTRLAIYVGIFKSVKMLTGTIGALFMFKQGLSLVNVASVQVFYSSTKLLLELPLGYFSDKYGRKLCAILGCLMVATGFLLTSTANNLESFVIAQIACACGWCFMSGSIERWLIESVREETPLEEHRINYLGHLRREIAGLGCMVTGPLGAFLTNWFGFAFVYRFSGFCFLILAIMFFTIPKVKNRHYHYSLTALKEVGNFLHKNKYMSMLYLLISIGLTLVYQVVYYFWQPLFLEITKNSTTFENLNMSFISFMGVIFFTSNLVIYLYNKFVKNRVAVMSDFAVFSLAIILSIIGVFLFYIISQIKSLEITAMLIFASIHGILSLVTSISDSQYYKHVESKWYGSIFSAMDTIQSLLAVLFLYLISFIVARSGVERLFFFSSFILIPIILFLVLWSFYVQKHTKRIKIKTSS